jgi:hypothetical protein
MKLNELEKSKLYVHTGLVYEPRRCEPLRFVGLEQQKGGFMAGCFVWADNGRKLLVADWAIEMYVEPYKIKGF